MGYIEYAYILPQDPKRQLTNPEARKHGQMFKNTLQTLCAMGILKAVVFYQEDNSRRDGNNPRMYIGFKVTGRERFDTSSL